MQSLVAAGSISDASKIYLDIWLLEKTPTVEFRVADVCLRVDEAVLLAGLIQSLLTFVRPALEEADDWAEVSALAAEVLRGGNGAMRQRAVFAETNRMEAVVDYILGETARGTEEAARVPGLQKAPAGSRPIGRRQGGGRAAPLLPYFPVRRTHLCRGCKKPRYS